MINVSFKHLSLEERELMHVMAQKGVSHRKIAEKLDRSQSSISRELKRNKMYGQTYF